MDTQKPQGHLMRRAHANYSDQDHQTRQAIKHVAILTGPKRDGQNYVAMLCQLVGLL